MTLRLRRRQALEIETGAAGSVPACPAASQGPRRRARAVPDHTDRAASPPPQNAEEGGQRFVRQAAAIIGRG